MTKSSKSNDIKYYKYQAVFEFGDDFQIIEYGSVYFLNEKSVRKYVENTYSELIDEASSYYVVVEEIYDGDLPF